jgi:hypothetical protein
VKTKNLFLVILIFILALQSVMFCGEVTKTGTTAAKFLSIGIGPRANAMGGAFTSLADDASAMYWNPAGIAILNQYEGIFTYTNLFVDIKLNYFGFVFPLSDFGTLGVNATILNYGEMEITTELDPEGIGTTFSAGSYALGLSYARFITEDFAVGATVKYVREDIYNSSAEGISFDLGTIFNTPFWDIRFSSSITNYGTKMQMTGEDLLIRHDPDPTREGNNESLDAYYATDEFELPLRLQAGMSKDFIFLDEQRLTLATDALFPNDNEIFFNVGAELALLNNLFAIRAGYKTIMVDDSPEGLTLGAGLNYDGMEYFGISVDYAFQEYQYLGNTHSFGVRLRF